MLLAPVDFLIEKYFRLPAIIDFFFGTRNFYRFLVTYDWAYGSIVKYPDNIKILAGHQEE